MKTHERKVGSSEPPQSDGAGLVRTAVSSIGGAALGASIASIASPIAGVIVFGAIIGGMVGCTASVTDNMKSKEKE